MNRLEKHTLIKKSWGSEVLWAHTDNYIVKTIELKPNSKTPYYIHLKMDKNFIVIDGEFYLTYGECCTEEPLKTYKLPVGWSWYVEPNMVYQYSTLSMSARIIEISSWEKDVKPFEFDEDGLNIKNVNSVLKPKKKRGRPKEIKEVG